MDLINRPPVTSESLADSLLKMIEKSTINHNYFKNYESDLDKSLSMKVEKNDEFIKKAQFHIDVLKFLDDKINDKINNQHNISSYEKDILQHDFLFSIVQRRLELVSLVELHKELNNSNDNSNTFSSDKIKSIRNKNFNSSDESKIKLN